MSQIVAHFQTISPCPLEFFVASLLLLFNQVKWHGMRVQVESSLCFGSPNWQRKYSAAYLLLGLANDWTACLPSLLLGTGSDREQVNWNNNKWMSEFHCVSLLNLLNSFRFMGVSNSIQSSLMTGWMVWSTWLAGWLTLGNSKGT